MGLLRAGLLLATWGCLLTFAGFLFFASSNSYQVALPTAQWATQWVFSSLDAPTTFFLLLTWGSLLAAALLTLALRRLAAPAAETAPPGERVQVRRCC